MSDSEQHFYDYTYIQKGPTQLDIEIYKLENTVGRVSYSSHEERWNGQLVGEDPVGKFTFGTFAHVVSEVEQALHRRLKKLINRGLKAAQEEERRLNNVKNAQNDLAGFMDSVNS